MVVIIIIILILLSHGIYMNNNWRPDGTGLDGLGWATEWGSD
jgi:hypothetical protein